MYKAANPVSNWLFLVPKFCFGGLCHLSDETRSYYGCRSNSRKNRHAVAISINEYMGAQRTFIGTSIRSIDHDSNEDSFS